MCKPIADRRNQQRCWAPVGCVTECENIGLSSQTAVQEPHRKHPLYRIVGHCITARGYADVGEAREVHIVLDDAILQRGIVVLQTKLQPAQHPCSARGSRGGRAKSGTSGAQAVILPQAFALRPLLVNSRRKTDESAALVGRRNFVVRKSPEAAPCSHSWQLVCAALC